MTQPRFQLYFWQTANCQKITIMLEELGYTYEITPINITVGEQLDPAFIQNVTVNNRVPVLVDREGPDGAPLTLFESGAILKYLARLSGKLAGETQRERALVDQWLMWQMAGLGPMSGQSFHFVHSAPAMGHSAQALAYGQTRYRDEVERLYRVMERHLSDGRAYMAGEAFSIADIAIWPWMIDVVKPKDMTPFAHVEAWHRRVGARDAVKAGMAVRVPEAA